MNATTIISSIIALLCTIITTFVIPWIKQKYGNEKLIKIENWVRIAVQAAEQIYTGTGLGDKKKAHVVKFLQKKGIKIDPDDLDEMIESAVHEIQSHI